MLITFTSSADADVIMFGEVGQHVLETLGKDRLAREGIITVEQIEPALLALAHAVEAERAVAQPEHEEHDADDAGTPRHPPVVRFAQRVVPLQDMLRRAQREAVPVQWQASGQP